MCDMVTPSGKDNGTEKGDRTSISMSSVFDLLTPKSIRNIFLPLVVYNYV
jgi:hypothetical protein